jgi:hypothetical protein
MKHFKIENNKVYYYLDSDWNEIDQISKEDLMILLDKSIATEFEMDEFDASSINHKAHQTIYRNIYQKFSEILDNKNKFIDQVEDLYKEAFDKYST